MDWTSSARVCALVGVSLPELRFLLFGAEKSTLRSRKIPTALALDFHPYLLYGRYSVWGLPSLRGLNEIRPQTEMFLRCQISSEFFISSFRAFLYIGAHERKKKKIYSDAVVIQPFTSYVMILSFSI